MFGDQLLTDITGQGTIISLLHYLNLPNDILLKYILFSGIFKIAPKTITTNYGIYDLLGSILIMDRKRKKTE